MEWDGVSCWPWAPVGETVSVSCPLPLQRHDFPQGKRTCQSKSQSVSSYQPAVSHWEPESTSVGFISHFLHQSDTIRMNLVSLLDLFIKMYISCRWGSRWKWKSGVEVEFCAHLFRFRKSTSNHREPLKLLPCCIDLYNGVESKPRGRVHWDSNCLLKESPPSWTYMNSKHYTLSKFK